MMSRAEYITTLSNLLNAWRIDNRVERSMPESDKKVWRAWLAMVREHDTEPVDMQQQELSTGDRFIHAHVGLMDAHSAKFEKLPGWPGNLWEVSNCAGRLIYWIECDNARTGRPHGAGLYPELPIRCMS